ncbi:MAG: methyltransferase domain-containing protein [Deltaproteobacteria bacterium]|nr:methyltransferase domain-containing protein [Deltaproteobacteria bacterium]
MTTGSNNLDHLRNGVREAYSRAAEKPQDEHPFPVGRRFAENIGYPKELLDEIPSISSDAFSGVSNVSIVADIPGGSTVLDLGCGAGLDTIIAARKTGDEGRVLGLDFSKAMLSRAVLSIKEAGIDNVEFFQGDAERIPARDESFDVVMVNGIFNLNPARDAIFKELARVVKRGGSVFAAELILKESSAEKALTCDASWFA